MSLRTKIKKLINVIQNTDINEIEVSSFWGAQKIRLSKNKVKNQNIPQSQDIALEDEIVIKSDEDIITNNDIVDVNKEVSEDITTQVTSKNDLLDEDMLFQKAPLVGTFYISSKAGEPPFVNVGDTVSKGQVLCIIEAMKIFNEIESDFNGEIIEILVEDQNPVEFNQNIFSIKPTE